jgi:hypothetical protein
MHAVSLLWAVQQEWATLQAATLGPICMVYILQDSHLNLSVTVSFSAPNNTSHKLVLKSSKI